MDLFPDLATTDDDELARLLRAAEDEADAISAGAGRFTGRSTCSRGAGRPAARPGRGRDARGLDAYDVRAADLRGHRQLPDDHDDPEPDLAALSDDELREQILELEREEDDISLRRRMLHGRIDILHAERERRRRGLHVQPDELGPILGRKPG